LKLIILIEAYNKVDLPIQQKGAIGAAGMALAA
jgi:hypothetical protein